MNKNFNTQKSITIISEEINLDDYFKCAIIQIKCSTKIIIVGENNIDKVKEILDKISNYKGGFDYLVLCDSDCYIHSSMIINKNIYKTTKAFLDDFEDVKDLYLESISYDETI